MDDRTSLEVPEITAQAPMGLAVLPEGHLIAISPINRRRWENFKTNRRGYWALWIFLVLFVTSLGAEFIANDKPLFVAYDGGYFPVFQTYPETTFGGEFETATDYRTLCARPSPKGRRHRLAADPLFPTPTISISLRPPSAHRVVDRRNARRSGRRKFSSCRDLEYNWLGTDDRASTSWRGCSTASGCRCCSG